MTNHFNFCFFSLSGTFFFCSIEDSFFKFLYSPRATYSGRLSKSKLMKRLQKHPIRSSEKRFLIPLFLTPIMFSRVCIHARWTCSIDLEMKWFGTFKKIRVQQALDWNRSRKVIKTGTHTVGKVTLIKLVVYQFGTEDLPFHMGLSLILGIDIWIIWYHIISLIWHYII